MTATNVDFVKDVVPCPPGKNYIRDAILKERMSLLFYLIRKKAYKTTC